MKYLILLLITVAVSGVSCRKKTLREIIEPNIVEESEVHCSDGVFNEGEQDLDCGGADCDPCITSLDAPCTPGQNYFELNGAIGTPSGNIQNVSCSDFGGEYRVTGDYSNGSITLYLGVEKPTFKRKYYITNNQFGDRGYGDASLSIQSGFSSTFTATSGVVYVDIVNGQITATFCDVPFVWTGSSSYNGTGSGSITCN